MIDSTTVAYIGKIITLNPSWSFVVLAFITALSYAVISLSKNTTLTERIAKSIDTHDSMANTVNEIRADQLVSNQEREKQGKAINDINTRLTKVEQDVEILKCAKSTCPNREG